MFLTTRRPASLGRINGARGRAIAPARVIKWTASRRRVRHAENARRRDVLAAGDGRRSQSAPGPSKWGRENDRKATSSGSFGQRAQKKKETAPLHNRQALLHSAGHSCAQYKTDIRWFFICDCSLSLLAGQWLHPVSISPTDAPGAANFPPEPPNVRHSAVYHDVLVRAPVPQRSKLIYLFFLFLSPGLLPLPKAGKKHSTGRRRRERLSPFHKKSNKIK